MPIDEKWAENGRKWREGVPWLSTVRSKSGQVLYVTCKLCKHHGEQTAPKWRTPASLQLCHFQIHEGTMKHSRAAASCGARDLLVALHAPPVGDFVKLLRDFRQGKTHGSKGCEGVGREWKVRKMKWCLAEAVRSRVRAAIRSAASMSIHADCSKGHLVVRARMCGEALDVSDGLLGVVNMLERDGSSALDLAMAIVTLMSDLATPCNAPPFPSAAQRQPTTIDEPLLLHMCSIVEVFNADAAADEQLSADILQKGIPNIVGGGAPVGPVLNGSGAPIFANLLVVNRDKAHAARRIVSRTWQCDQYLDAIAQGIVMGQHSVVQLIRHKDTWRSRHARHLRQLQHTPVWTKALTGVVGAKHRFDSWQKPFARVCLSFDAIVATAQAMHEERRSEPAGRFGKACLSLLDEESMLTLGMLADAGEETLELIRFMDEERADKVELCFVWRRFLDRVTVLFDRGGCLSTGYTGHMLHLARTEKVVYVDRVPKRIGGRDPAALQPIIDRCLKRLRHWVCLARDVVAAEFPEFETLQAFSVRRLQSQSDRRRWANGDEERRNMCDRLTKLARVMKLDMEKLQEQCFDHLPIAQFEFDTTTPACTPFIAWKTAIERGSHHGSHRRRHPTDELLKLLVRAGAWGMSTSGVERTFSQSRASLTVQRTKMLETHKRDDIFLLSTSNDNQTVDDALAKAAAELWVGVYGPRRTCKENGHEGGHEK